MPVYGGIWYALIDRPWKQRMTGAGLRGSYVFGMCTMLVRRTPCDTTSRLNVEPARDCCGFAAAEAGWAARAGYAICCRPSC